MILFLALLARAGHGKSTAAAHFSKRYGAKTVSLATPLKRVAQKVMGFSNVQLWGTQEAKEAVDRRFDEAWAGSTELQSRYPDGFSPRRFLQLLGTEGLRQEFGENIHLDRLVQLTSEDYARQIASTTSAIVDAERRPAPPDQVYIVDDARFRNEISYLNGLALRFPLLMSGTTIKIVCTDAPPPAGDLATHPSEMEIDLVPNGDLAATVVSSRAQGVDHLVGEIEREIAINPLLVRFRCLRKAA